MTIKNKTTGHLPGKLFIFEGLDGVGKSTLAEKVADKLRKAGKDVLLVSFPGHEPNTLGKLVYSIHHNQRSYGVEQISPISLQLLHIAAHIDCIEKQIVPSLYKGKIVILDRYWWSTAAYGIASGIEKNVISSMIDLEITIWDNIKPYKLFIVTCDKPYKNELTNNQRLLLNNAYQTLIQEQKNYYPVEIIENTRPLEVVIDSVLNHFKDSISHRTGKQKIQQESFTYYNYKDISINKSRIQHLLPTKTTEVFDTYWRFAAERQDIFFKRLRRLKLPWTDDLILQEYKFTNAYRASDRVSQYLIKNVIYEGPQEPDEILFRILLFKTFNKIETWQLLINNLKYITWREFNFSAYDRILTKAQEAKKSIYSAAYIMPSGGNSFGNKVKHRNHLYLIQKMMKDDLSAKICNSKSMQEVFELLRSYPMVGNFLAYQYATDINYSSLTDFKEMSFVVPGPGARDGIRKCFSDPGGFNEVDLIKLMADRQEDEFSRLGLEFKNLWGRPLQLIDCQNLFCEVDKYARIAHPNIKGLTGRNKIKQRFRPIKESIEYFFPPKWGINEAINNLPDEVS